MCTAVLLLLLLESVIARGQISAEKAGPPDAHIRGIR